MDLRSQGPTLQRPLERHPRFPGPAHVMVQDLLGQAVGWPEAQRPRAEQCWGVRSGWVGHPARVAESGYITLIISDISSVICSIDTND